jgi:hypothetical protein
MVADFRNVAENLYRRIYRGVQGVFTPPSGAQHHPKKSA